VSERRWRDRTKTPRSRLWERRAPPVERRQKLWTMRNRMRFGLRYSPYKSPRLPGARRPRIRREIYLARETEW